MNRHFVMLLAVVAAVYFPARASADERPVRNGEATVVYGTEAPTGDELRRVLFGDPAGVALNTRGLVMMEVGGTTPAPAVATQAAAPTMTSAQTTAVAPAVATPQAPSVAFTIEFAFDSAEVPAQYMAHLAAMAEALKSADARTARTTIVGHTDARGGATYNAVLSLRRAEATRKVLVERYGVDAARLAARGVGEEQLLAGIPAEAAPNRRVEFKVN
jgi:outer membrane protein OmpA-like peptidoglycan-associated protein